MDWFLVIARLLLAGVFLAAATGKLLGRQQAVAPFAAFGVPAPLIKPGSILLPMVELLVAVGLLLTSTAQAGAIGALVLLAAFALAMVLSVRRGDELDCNCFGSLHSERIGAGTIIRNTALAAIAAAIASQVAQPAIDTWVSHRSASDLALLSVSVALAATVGLAGGMWRRNRAAPKQRSAAAQRRPRAVGTRAPSIRLEDVTGRRVSLKSLLSDSPVIGLLFLGPDCESCDAVLSDLPRWQVPLARDLPIHVVSSAAPDQTRAMANRYQLDGVLIDPRGATAKRYRIWRTPTALIVGANGRLASGPATGPAAIEALIRHALVRQSAANAPIASAPAVAV